MTPRHAQVYTEHHRPEQTTLYRVVQQHAGTFFAEVEAVADVALGGHLVRVGAELPINPYVLQRSARLPRRRLPTVADRPHRETRVG